MDIGTISKDDGNLVWDGDAWVPHGIDAFVNANAEKPRLVKKDDGTWQPYTYLFISTPCYDGTAFCTHVSSIMNLERGLRAQGVLCYFSWPRGDGIARCRNRQIREFLGTTATHMCCIDADIGFEPQHLVDMVTSGLDVVFGAYPAKGYEWKNIFDGIKSGAIETPEEMEKAGIRFVVNYHDDHIARGEFPSIKLDDRRTFVELKEGSTGFMVIRRHVIERLTQAYPELAYADDYPGALRGVRMWDLFHMGIDPTGPLGATLENLKGRAIAVATGKGTAGELVTAAVEYKRAIDGQADDRRLSRYLSEDYGFCRLWTRLGGKVWVYLGAQLSHMGQCCYQGAFGRQFTAHKPEDVSAPPVPPPVPQLTNGEAHAAQQEVAI